MKHGLVSELLNKVCLVFFLFFQKSSHSVVLYNPDVNINTISSVNLMWPLALPNNADWIS